MRPASCEASYGVRKVDSKIYHGGAEGTGGSVVVYMSKGEFARGSNRACTRRALKNRYRKQFLRKLGEISGIAWKNGFDKG